MELDVTHMVNDADDMLMISGSIAELGQNAAKLTWRNAQQYASSNILLTDETALDAARDWFKGFGVWEDNEIAAWSDAEVNALVVQFIAGEIREMEVYDSMEEYQKASEGGQTSGRLSTGDGGRWYFYLGN